MYQYLTIQNLSLFFLVQKYASLFLSIKIRGKKGFAEVSKN